MDSEKRTPENENNPAQNELDLGFSQMEPITPKKVIKPEPSLFEKLLGKGKAFLAKKEQKNMENQFAVRKEPVFGGAGATGEQSMTSENPTEKFSTENTDSNEPQITADTAKETPIEAPAEPLVTEAEEAIEATQPEPAELKEKPKAGFKNPENWAILSILPQKHRRIFVALFGVVLVLIFILWMKPSSDTVQSYEQQSNNGVPIQFQQLDQSQTVEPTVLDNPAPQTDNTAAQQPAAETNTQNANVAGTEPQVVEQGVATSVAEQTTTVAVENKPAEVKPEAVETVKPSEPAKAQEAVKPHQHQESVKKEPVKTGKVKQAEKGTAKNQPTKSAKTEKEVRDILEGKTTTITKAAAGSKTLTIQQGVTLMQVFRDNHLPVGDVNAMTKAKGVGKVLSSFKPGDKVQVSLNAQGRVSELRLPNGARFTRQSDGSYQFKK
ncbi:opacity-associated protein OapA [Aggregatibacter actinomycetemcomitans]|uniref:opacity-associated protein OapA n=1 Tax=Aggregatibacter actinomycetemcomitans TaxID=714 RepID=UPI0011D914DB|nr:opacity-associated protein OapA [Aggregatibacter actinomycetemcomitans]QEH48150.1 opacity-associated protein OapA [Aggregatibacter actinomycetemcomitans]TYA50046.1 opacity-associated protein OapA [Aggregatibacter actinomycetemcomitans]